MPSVYPESGRTAWILQQRPPRRTAPDPNTPHGVFRERERLASGEIVDSGVVLLTNRECPWRCLMCDLWQDTLTAPTPAGAIPRQIEHAIDAWSQPGASSSPPTGRDACATPNPQLGVAAGLRACQRSDRTPSSGLPLPAQIKLYNSGSFFDGAAIPRSDYAAIAGLVSFARHVVVESHPLLIGDATLTLRDLLAAGRSGERQRDDCGSGSTLEVAMGLETAHPVVLEMLNKKFSLDQFARSAAFLAREGIALRVFLLVNPPFLPADPGVAWAIKSAAFAFDCGASAVTLIPTRPGNGAMDRLLAAGEWTPPTLADLEAAQAGALALKLGRVFADTWGLERFSACPKCWSARQARIERMNLTQTIEPEVECGCFR